MKRTLVRYKAKPEMAHENERLITDVFRELQAKAPDGVRYAALRLDDGCRAAGRTCRHDRRQLSHARGVTQG
jgi:hypothetical protein